jgi:hypothetical protein
MARESDQDRNRATDATAALQGIKQPDWFSPLEAELARETNEIVLAIAAREMEPGLAATDFARLIAGAARRAEADADRGS